MCLEIILAAALPLAPQVAKPAPPQLGSVCRSYEATWGGKVDRHHRHAAWWQLYLLVAVAVGFLVLEAGARLSEAGHEEAAVAIVLGLFCLLAGWLHANEWALESDPQEKPMHGKLEGKRPPVYIRWTPPEEPWAIGDEVEEDVSHRPESPCHAGRIAGPSSELEKEQKR
jgi:hypothetical protein